MTVSLHCQKCGRHHVPGTLCLQVVDADFSAIEARVMGHLVAQGIPEAALDYLTRKPPIVKDDLRRCVHGASIATATCGCFKFKGC